MTRASSPHAPRGAGPPPVLVAAAIASLAGAVLLWWRAPSLWLQAWSPDGALNPRTARFLDALRFVVAATGAIGLVAALRADVRTALAATWRRAAPERGTASLGIPIACGALATGLRLVLGAAGDPCLGDDGARVAWVAAWIQDPRPVWSGIWLPGHLYLHGLVSLVVRDPVWAGIGLSAVAAGGTSALLARAVARDWGRAAGIGAGVGTAILPVSLAHGSTPDVNPLFTFLAVAAVAAVRRARATRSWRAFALGALALAWATWCRFDAIALVPGVALLLWPHRARVAAFAVASLVPFTIWNIADAIHTGQVGHVAHVVQNDPSLGGSWTSSAFSWLGGLWQAAPLPCLVLGTAGAVRALRGRRGRAWLVLAVLHTAALAGTAVLFQAGTQPRYFMLIGAVLAAYAGVALGGIFAASRRAGWTVVAGSLVALVLAPAAFPGEGDLWMRRSPRLRQLVDRVQAESAGADVVWVADESACFYLCRTGVPIERYHAMPRADSDPAALLAELGGATAAVACVQQTPLSRDRWSRFETLAAPEWRIRRVGDHDEYRLYELIRDAGPRPDSEESR